jgi:hypothetical protein
MVVGGFCWVPLLILGLKTIMLGFHDSLTCHQSQRGDLPWKIFPLIFIQAYSTYDRKSAAMKRNTNE